MTVVAGEGFEREQALFFQCLDSTQAQRQALLDAAPPALAARVRRLLELDARAERGEFGLGPEPVAPMPAQLGPFHLLDRLGEGGMGAVYLGRQDVPVRRLVAVKVLRPGLETPELLARFQAEQQAMARLQHPGIARLLDAGLAGPGKPYLAMDYVDGEALPAFVHGRDWPLRERLALFVRLCLAVAHAHQKGVIHRDLKPGNVLVMDAGQGPHPVVIDFGIAKLFGDAARAGPETVAGAWMGTPDYMAPEQAGGDPRRVDTRSDVWALGAMLFELLAGVPPFGFADAGTPLAEVQQVLQQQDAPRPSQRVRERGDAAHARRCGFADAPALARALAGELDWVVRRALARDPARRYPSASALAADVQRVLDDAPVDARPPSFAYLAGKLARRHAGLAAGASVLVAALAVVALLTGLHARDLAAERERTRAEAARANEVTAFVTSLFSQADARRGDRDQLSARELLDSAALRLDESPAADPRTQAELLATVATLYEGLGLFEPTRDLRARALAVREGLGEPVETAKIRARLGVTQLRLGKYDEARALLRESYDALLRHGAPPDEVAYAGMGLADTLRSSGDPAVGPLLAEVMARMERDGLGTTTRYACALVQVGRQHRAEGDLEQAEKAMQRALILLNAEEPQMHECQGGARSSLALVLQDLGKLEDAQAVTADLVTQLREALGDTHPDTLVAMNNLGLILAARGRDAEALPWLDRAAQGLAERLGSEHPVALQAAMNRTLSAVETGAVADAAAAYAGLLARVDAVVPDPHPLRAMLNHHHAGALASAGDLVAAEAAARRAVAQFSAGTAPSTVHLLRARARLAEVLGKRGEHAQARELFDAVLREAEAALGAGHADTLRYAAARAALPAS